MPPRRTSIGMPASRRATHCMKPLLALARPALKAVQRRLTNVHYRRFRTVDTVNGKYLATAFHEEMLFT